MTRLRATDVGRAVAHSGLTPRTAQYFLNYIREHGAELARLFVQQTAVPGTVDGATIENLERANADLAFVIFHLVYASPEYGTDDVDARRFIPFPLGDRRASERAVRLEPYLTVWPWDRNTLAVNAADISVDWCGGIPLAELESRFSRLRGGMIRDMLRAVASQLAGLADVLTAVLGITAQVSPASLAWVTPLTRRLMFRLVRRVRQYALQAIVGLPEDLLWMAEVTAADGQPLIRRPMALSLTQHGFTTLEDLLDAGRTNQFLIALGRGPGAAAAIPRIRQAAQRVRLERTGSYLARIKKRLPDCEQLADAYFAAREKTFEDRLNDCFECVGIKVIERDGQDRKKPHFPDFHIELDAATPLILECKSTTNDRGVTLGQATEVAGKAATYGLGGHHQVTVCQRYVSTDVPRAIEAATNLSVVNAEELASALAYVKLGTVSLERFRTWITTPGQPRVQELFGN